MSPSDPEPALPAVDERLVAPETRYEIMDGMVVYMPPADPPHGEMHTRLGALLMAHRADDFNVALDMLTRTSRIDDIAPDASVYPAARNPVTGGRQLEHMAFEIVSTQSLGNAAKKASKLSGRGVRRVFAIDIERGRALEWSAALGEWSILDQRDVIADPALAVPLRIEVLLDTMLADDAVVRAFQQKRHPAFEAERAEGRAQGLAESVLTFIEARGLVATDEQRAQIVTERDLQRLSRWVVAAASCGTVADILAVD